MIQFEDGEVLKGPKDVEDMFWLVVGGYLILVAVILIGCT